MTTCNLHNGKKKVPITSMYGIFTYICLIFMVNVGKYMEIHGLFGVWNLTHMSVKRQISPCWPSTLWLEKMWNASDISTIKDHAVHFQFIPKSTTKKRAQGGPWKVVTDGDGGWGWGWGWQRWGQPDPKQPTFPISGKTWTYRVAV